MLNCSNNIKVRALYKAFAGQHVLNDVDLTLEGGILTLLSGPNGAGKSTLLRIIAGLEKPDSGRIDFGDGEKKWQKAKPMLFSRVLYLHQQPYMFDGSIEYNLRFALPRKMKSKECNRLIAQAIEWAGLSAQLNTPAKKLSGGERQRLALARAWLRKPDVVLLDEPTSNMDRAARGRTLELLEALKTEGIALLAASHDPDHFASLADQQIHLRDGQLIQLDSHLSLWPSSSNIAPIQRAIA